MRIRNKPRTERERKTHNHESVWRKEQERERDGGGSCGKVSSSAALSPLPGFSIRSWATERSSLQPVAPLYVASSGGGGRGCRTSVPWSVERGGLAFCCLSLPPSPPPLILVKYLSHGLAGERGEAAVAPLFLPFFCLL